MAFLRSHALLVLALLAAVAPLASAASGPFAGTVRQGETDVHRFDNSPPKGGACIDMVTTYTVSLTYAPGGDALSLSANGRTATGSDGYASVSFQSGVCTAFNVLVTGTQVADAAAYAVTVTSGALGGGGSWG